MGIVAKFIAFNDRTSSNHHLPEIHHVLCVALSTDSVLRLIHPFILLKQTYLNLFFSKSGIIRLTSLVNVSSSNKLVNSTALIKLGEKVFLR